MQASRLEDGEGGFAFGLIQAYFIDLVVCGALALGSTGRFLYQNRHEFTSLVKIIRYRAVEADANVDLENGKNDQWEMDSAHPNEDDPAGSDYDDTESKDEDDSGKWCPNCKDYNATGWTCSCDQRNYSLSNPYEGKDENPWPRYINEGEDNEGKGDNELEEDDPAGSGYSDTETEDEENPNEWWCRFCKEYQTPGWSCSCVGDPVWSRCNDEGEDEDDRSRYDNEDEGNDQHDCPDSNNDSDAPHLTPSASGSDAEVNTINPTLPTFKNWYAPADDTESCSSCDSEYTKTIPWTTPAAHREPLTPTSPTGYVAGVEDNDDGEESEVSDGATIGEPEGGDTETWNNGDSSISYGSTPGQGFQSEQEDTGPLNNVQEPSDQTTSAQEQRPQPTGTAFSLPNLPARHANILVDETGHAQGPPVGEFRHGIAKPLRLTIPTQRIINAEPGAPTTPANTHSLAQWPGTAYAGNSWRDV